MPDSVTGRIIVPLDVASESAAIALLDQLPQVQFWKVGLELFTSCGPSLITILKARQKRIFLDLKFHDIPNTVAGACAAAGRYGVELVTIHATAGRQALKAGLEALQQGAEKAQVPSPQLIAITLLTSLSSRSLAFDLKIPLELPEYILHMALMAQDCDLGGVVCSPQEAAQLRQVCGEDFLLVCPGVRPQGSGAGDQQRAMTPSAALAAGASYLVIGRPITTAADPAQAFEQICQEIVEGGGV